LATGLPSHAYVHDQVSAIIAGLGRDADRVSALQHPRFVARPCLGRYLVEQHDLGPLRAADQRRQGQFVRGNRRIVRPVISRPELNDLELDGGGGRGKPRRSVYCILPGEDSGSRPK
jgi:hypothetical protein